MHKMGCDMQVLQAAKEAEPQMQHLDDLMSRWQQGSDVSLARTDFAQQAEAAINEQVRTFIFLTGVGMAAGVVCVCWAQKFCAAGGGHHQ